MKAVAVIPGQANSIHLAELPKPSIHEIPNGRGVLAQVLRVGVDGTDKEINAAEYGQAPPGYDFLVIGHECVAGCWKSAPASRSLCLAITWCRLCGVPAAASATKSASTT